MLGLSGCSIGTAVGNSTEAAIYKTPAEAAGVPENLALPGWVPADAAMIRIRTNTSSKASILTFTVAQPITTPIGQACSPEELGKKPSVFDSWWPISLPSEGVACSGEWRIFAVGTQLYGWKP